MFKRILSFIIDEWRSVRLCLAVAVLIAFMIWLSFWAMARTQEIRERERLGGRYVGLNAITEVREGGK